MKKKKRLSRSILMLALIALIMIPSISGTASAEESISEEKQAEIGFDFCEHYSTNYTVLRENYPEPYVHFNCDCNYKYVRIMRRDYVLGITKLNGIFDNQTILESSDNTSYGNRWFSQILAICPDCGEIVTVDRNFQNSLGRPFTNYGEYSYYAYSVTGTNIKSEVVIGNHTYSPADNATLKYEAWALDEPTAVGVDTNPGSPHCWGIFPRNVNPSVRVKITIRADGKEDVIYDVTQGPNTMGRQFSSVTSTEHGITYFQQNRVLVTSTPYTEKTRYAPIVNGVTPSPASSTTGLVAGVANLTGDEASDFVVKVGDPIASLNSQQFDGLSAVSGGTNTALVNDGGTTSGSATFAYVSDTSSSLGDGTVYTKAGTATIKQIVTDWAGDSTTVTRKLIVESDTTSVYKFDFNRDGMIDAMDVAIVADLMRYVKSGATAEEIEFINYLFDVGYEDGTGDGLIDATDWSHAFDLARWIGTPYTVELPNSLLGYYTSLGW